MNTSDNPKNDNSYECPIVMPEYPGAFRVPEFVAFLHHCMVDPSLNSENPPLFPVPSTIQYQNPNNQSDTSPLLPVAFLQTQYTKEDYEAILLSKKGKVKCSICGKELLKESVKYHAKTHDKFRDRLACGICGKDYYEKANLRLHLKSVHSQDELGDLPVVKYICGVCKESFASSENLNTHKLEKHTQK